MRPIVHASILAAIAASTLVTPTLAQTTHLFSPTFLKGAEGRYFTRQFGSHPSMRYQMVDGENRGNVSYLKDIAIRLDHRSHSSVTTASGRSWTTVVVDLAEGDVSSMTNVFSTNMLSTPTQVFSGSINWPHYNGTPPSRPTLWGGFNGDYVVPFKTSWRYVGQKDILSDWRFDGGTLDNATTWTGPRGYWFDSYQDPDEPLLGTYRRLPAKRLHNNSQGVTTRCNDTYFGSNALGAYASVFARVYGPSASNTNWRNKLVMWSSSYYTAPGTSVIHAWAFATNKIGFEMMTGCNRLHLLGLTLFFTLPVKPANVNPLGFAALPPLTTNWVIDLSTLRVVVQAGWRDSVDQRLRLSQAQEVVLPGDKPPRAPQRSAIYQIPNFPVVGPDKTYFANPGLRYLR